MKAPTVIKDYQLFRYIGCTEMIIIMEQLVDYLVDYELRLPLFRSKLDYKEYAKNPGSVEIIGKVTNIRNTDGVVLCDVEVWLNGYSLVEALSKDLCSIFTAALTRKRNISINGHECEKILLERVLGFYPEGLSDTSDAGIEYRKNTKYGYDTFNILERNDCYALIPKFSASQYEPTEDNFLNIVTAISNALVHYTTLQVKAGRLFIVEDINYLVDYYYPGKYEYREEAHELFLKPFYEAGLVVRIKLPDEIKSIKMDATDFETKENK